MSGVTALLGSGKGGAFRLLFEFSFAFAFAGLTSVIGDGDTSAFAFKLVLTFAFAGEVITPPAGMPSSPLPVGGWPGLTGWLFGSATRVGWESVFELADGVD